MNRILNKLTLAAVATGALVASVPANAAAFITSIKITNPTTYLQVAEVQAFSGTTNVALAANGGTATASSVYQPDFSTPGKAIDGNTGGNYYSDTIYHGLSGSGADTLTISFAGANVSTISIFGRTDCCSERDVYSYTLYNGTSVVGSGSVNGTKGVASFAVSAVPEATTWTMMIAGFGMVGFGLRSRRKQAVRVTYA